MATRAIDFSDIGGKRVQPAAPAQKIDFSDLGGKLVAPPEGPWVKYAQQAGPWTKYAQPTPSAWTPVDESADLSGVATGFEAYGEPLQTVEGRQLQTKALKTVAPYAAGAGIGMIAGPGLIGGALAGATPGIVKGLVSPERYSGVGEFLEDIGFGAASGAALASIPGGWRAVSKLWQAAPSEEQAIARAVGIKPPDIVVGSKGDILVDPRTAVRNAGLSARTLSRMTPGERVAAIGAAKDAANNDLQAALSVSDAKLNLTAAIRKAGQKSMASKALEPALNDLRGYASDLGIDSLEEVTPAQARELQRYVRGNASFLPQVDPRSRAGIGAAFYRAIGGEIDNAVPGAAEMDDNVAGLIRAANAARRQVQAEAVKVPPTLWQKASPVIKTVGPALGGIGGGLYGAARLYDLLGQGP
jgi:hypothetical protein